MNSYRSSNNNTDSESEPESSFLSTVRNTNETPDDSRLGSSRPYTSSASTETGGQENRRGRSDERQLEHVQRNWDETSSRRPSETISSIIIAPDLIHFMGESDAGQGNLRRTISSPMLPPITDEQFRALQDEIDRTTQRYAAESHTASGGFPPVRRERTIDPLKYGAIPKSPPLVQRRIVSPSTLRRPHPWLRMPSRSQVTGRSQNSYASGLVREPAERAEVRPSLRERENQGRQLRPVGAESHRNPSSQSPRDKSPEVSDTRTSRLVYSASTDAKPLEGGSVKAEKKFTPSVSAIARSAAALRQQNSSILQRIRDRSHQRKCFNKFTERNPDICYEQWKDEVYTRVPGKATRREAELYKAYLEVTKENQQLDFISWFERFRPTLIELRRTGEKLGTIPVNTPEGVAALYREHLAKTSSEKQLTFEKWHSSVLNPDKEPKIVIQETPQKESYKEERLRLYQEFIQTLPPKWDMSFQHWCKLYDANELHEFDSVCRGDELPDSVPSPTPVLRPNSSFDANFSDKETIERKVAERHAAKLKLKLRGHELAEAAKNVPRSQRPVVELRRRPTTPIGIPARSSRTILSRRPNSRNLSKEWRSYDHYSSWKKNHVDSDIAREQQRKHDWRSQQRENKENIPPDFPSSSPSSSDSEDDSLLTDSDVSSWPKNRYQHKGDKKKFYISSEELSLSDGSDSVFERPKSRPKSKNDRSKSRERKRSHSQRRQRSTSHRRRPIVTSPMGFRHRHYSPKEKSHDRKSGFGRSDSQRRRNPSGQRNPEGLNPEKNYFSEWLAKKHGKNAKQFLFDSQSYLDQFPELREQPDDDRVTRRIKQIARIHVLENAENVNNAVSLQKKLDLYKSMYEEAELSQKAYRENQSKKLRLKTPQEQQLHLMREQTAAEKQAAVGQQMILSLIKQLAEGRPNSDHFNELLLKAHNKVKSIETQVSSRQTLLDETNDLAKLYKTKLERPKVKLTDDYPASTYKLLEARNVLSAVKPFNPEVNKDQDFSDTWRHILSYTRSAELTEQSYIDILAMVTQGYAHNIVHDLSREGQSLDHILDFLTRLYCKKKTILDDMADLNKFKRRPNESIECAMSRAEILADKVKPFYPKECWQFSCEKILTSVLKQIISKNTRKYIEHEEMKCLHLGAILDYKAMLNMIDTYEHANQETPQQEVGITADACSGVPVSHDFNYETKITSSDEKALADKIKSLEAAIQTLNVNAGDFSRLSAKDMSKQKDTRPEKKMSQYTKNQLERASISEDLEYRGTQSQSQPPSSAQSQSDRRSSSSSQGNRYQRTEQAGGGYERGRQRRRDFHKNQQRDQRQQSQSQSSNSNYENRGDKNYHKNSFSSSQNKNSNQSQGFDFSANKKSWNNYDNFNKSYPSDNSFSPKSSNYNQNNQSQSLNSSTSSAFAPRSQNSSFNSQKNYKSKFPDFSNQRNPRSSSWDNNKRSNYGNGYGNNSGNRQRSQSFNRGGYSSDGGYRNRDRKSVV